MMVLWPETLPQTASIVVVFFGFVKAGIETGTMESWSGWFHLLHSRRYAGDIPVLANAIAKDVDQTIAVFLAL